MKGKIVAKIINSKPVQQTVKAAVEHAPQLLTGLSIASSITSTVFAVKGTILAVKSEEKRKKKIESGELPEPKHPVLKIIKCNYKYYIASAFFMAMSIGSAIYGVDILGMRLAMATAECAAKANELDELVTKFEEKMGSEKVNDIRQEIEKERVDQLANRQTPIVAPFEKYLCKEEYSGVEFYSNLFEIKDIFIELNYDLLHGRGDELSMSSYLDKFGIDSSEEDVGWNVGMTGLLILSYSSEMDSYGRPMIVFGPTQRPYENYNIYS